MNRRQLTTTIYQVGFVEMQQGGDGRYDKVFTPICEVEDTTMNRTKERAAIKEAVGACPRGTETESHALRQRRYYFTTDELMGICSKVEEIEI